MNNSVVFHPDNLLVTDVRVRRVLLHATNTDEIVSTLFTTHYSKATSVIAKTALGYVDLFSKLTCDLEEAKAPLDEAGWKVGAERSAPEGRAPCYGIGTVGPRAHTIEAAEKIPVRSRVLSRIVPTGTCMHFLASRMASRWSDAHVSGLTAMVCPLCFCPSEQGQDRSIIFYMVGEPRAFIQVKRSCSFQHLTTCPESTS
ncbi:ABC transporter substrate-binding protein [Microvirga sp. KLBC 81]|uniref:ABC transporter substrate-binding protein n=1 Tax=Microvirga sp. KLBC 81 TaxID=1862707 RepID=UPI001FE177C1|nr:ABC transporter substrate-binding protein [Microvirga sp. KLBC 81]